MDHTVYATAAALRDELSAMLNHTRAGHPGIAMVHPGDIVPMYGCPLAAVRVVNITPDTRTLRSGVCGTTLHIATLEMVVDRCYTTPDDNAMPTLGVLDSHARDAIDDAAAMRVAAQCFRTGPPSTLLGPWTSRVAGGILRGDSHLHGDDRPWVWLRHPAGGVAGHRRPGAAATGRPPQFGVT